MKWTPRSNRKGSTYGSHVVVTDLDGNFKRVENGAPIRYGKIANETLMFKLLNNMFKDIEHLDHYRPEWMLNPETGFPLELDRYYPGLNIAFEYNGKHHLGQKQRAKDKVKKRVCRERGIALVVIKASHSLDANEVKRLIRAEQKALADRTV